MSKPSTAGTEPRRAVLRLLEARPTPISDLPVLRALLAEFASRVATAMGEVTGMTSTATLDSVSQSIANELAVTPLTAVTVFGWIPEWGAPAFCRIDKQLLFRALDVMYGGEPRAGPRMPGRDLTPLEGSFAALLGGTLLRCLAAAVEDICPFTVQSVRYVEEQDLGDAKNGKSEYLVLRLNMVEHDGHVMLGIPIVGLDHARERLVAEDEAVATTPDPVWMKAFHESIVATPIQLVASAAGPDMQLSDVARLRAGSMLEFPGSRLRNLVIEGGEKAVFKGRLGQSKGMYAVSIEQPFVPTAEVGDEEQP